jgi:hypothetical protein
LRRTRIGADAGALLVNSASSSVAKTGNDHENPGMDKTVQPLN